MAYYRCPGCGLTTHSVAGRLSTNICPNCSAPLAAADAVRSDGRLPPFIRRRFAADAGSATAARRELDDLAWTLDDEESYVLALLVTELISNTVRHTGTETVGLEVGVSDEVVRVKVLDDGRGFVSAFRTGASPLDSHWGLYLLDELADRWEVTSTPSTAVSFELDRGSTLAASEPGRLGRALSEQARLGDAYERAVGTPAEAASFARLKAAGREVAASDAAAAGKRDGG
jgi:anti-sigma regulatory factor (Ser/Thr protein kinase)